LSGLAEQMLDDGELAELQELVDLHQREDAADVQAVSYQVTLLIERKQWDKAIQVLEESLKKDADASQGGLRYQFVLALYRAGRWQDAYQRAHAASREETFSQLAHLLLADKKS